jgi:hypothetical protein
MITSKETLETTFKQLLTEKTEALKKMDYEKVSELRDKVNDTLMQLEKITGEMYIKIKFNYKKTKRGYYLFIES